MRYIPLNQPGFRGGSAMVNASGRTQTELMIVIAVTRHRDGDHDYAEFCRRLWASVI